MSNKKQKDFGEGSISPEDIRFYFPERFTPDFDWSKISTRHLLDMLRSNAGRNDPEYNAILKKVLSTREHIPTAKEAKELRKQKYKEKVNR